MTQPEVQAAVVDYLTRFSAATVRDLRLALRCEPTEAQVRAALRKAGAHGRTFGDWQKHPVGSPERTEAWRRARYQQAARYKPHSAREPYSEGPERFTLYRLRPWETRSVPA